MYKKTDCRVCLAGQVKILLVAIIMIFSIGGGLLAEGFDPASISDGYIDGYFYNIGKEETLGTPFNNYRELPYNYELVQQCNLTGDEGGGVFQIVKKDPFIAGFLSWLMMGTGQIYCQDYTRGSIFMALDLLDRVVFVGLVSYVNKKYSPKGDEVINLNWQSFDPSTKLIILGYIVAKYGIRFYNVYDAIQAAKRYNSIYIKKVYKEGKTALRILPGSIQVGYSGSF